MTHAGVIYIMDVKEKKSAVIGLSTFKGGRKMRFQKAVWGLLFGCCLVLSGRGEAVESKLKGVMYADYYYNASGADKEQNGFQFRRVYLTFDLKWDDAFSGRVRLESKDGGFGSGKKMEPFVKHAYVRYQKDRHTLYMGLSGTPTWNITEGIWGYRPVEKTIMDRNKIASSADIGLAYHGRLDEEGKANVQVMLANGNGQVAENNNQKKIYGLIHFKPGSLNLTAYGDWEKRAGGNRTTFAAFLGIKNDTFQGGLEAFTQLRKNPDHQARGVSLFGAGKLSDRAKGFARVDLFDPHDKTAGDRKIFFVGGIDFEPVKDIHIIPNVMGTSFQGGVDADVMPRMTLYVKF